APFRPLGAVHFERRLGECLRGNGGGGEHYAPRARIGHVDSCYSSERSGFAATGRAIGDPPQADACNQSASDGSEVQAVLVGPKFAVAELQVQPAYQVSLASRTAPM